MAVNTIFLQTTNEGSNQYGDTTFNIHVPVKDKSYKLTCASFMFRPKIILMEHQWVTFRFTIEITALGTQDEMDAWQWNLRNATDNTCIVQVPITDAIQFNPSKTEVTQMKDLITNRVVLQCPYEERTDISGPWQRKTIGARYELNQWTWTLSPTYTAQVTVDKLSIDNSMWYNPNITFAPTGLTSDKVSFMIRGIELVDMSPELKYFSGMEPGRFIRQENPVSYTYTAPRAYNPHYWNYITLSCNKSYNTGNVVNQERYNHDIDDSSQFYKGQILAYMPNNAYAPEAMQTGMATANEYIIQPADFNSIRFWLNYDNGEPVKLCSPMTIVLNMMPNQ